MMRRAVLLLPIFCALLSAADPKVDAFIRSYTDEWMRFHTDNAASQRYFKGPEGDAMERQIEPQTVEWRDAERKLVRSGLTRLKGFDRSKMSAAQQSAVDIITWDLQTRADGEAFQDYSFPFTQTGGAQSGLVSLLTVVQPVRTEKDAENYIARLRLVAPRMEESITEARRLIAKQLVPPKFILEATAAQIRTFIAMTPSKNPFVATFEQRLADVPGLTGPGRAQLRSRAEAITTSEIYPAWRHALAVLEAEIPKATNDAGLWRFPNGVEAYNHRLKQFTTTKLTADQIHDLGLRMVAEIEGKMDTVLRQLGYTDGSVRVRMDKMRADQPQFPNTEQGRAEYSALIAGIIADAEKRSAKLFDRVPKAKVIAQAYPDFMGARAPSYTIAAPDGSRPGTYQYPVVGVPLTRFGIRTVAYHEAIPGHHFQGALQMEDATLPAFLQKRIFGNNSAIGEGWGLYAERLAAEDGWYEGDPVGLLGQLDASVFRARRLIVDTGLHAKHWTREQAIEYLGPNPAGSAVAEVERYVAGPGQACSYMIGELKIVELRERAKQQLGGKFSLREFHNVVLGAGRVPLDILETTVNRWIDSKKG